MKIKHMALTRFQGNHSVARETRSWLSRAVPRGNRKLACGRGGNRRDYSPRVQLAGEEEERFLSAQPDPSQERRVRKNRAAPFGMTGGEAAEKAEKGAACSGSTFALTLPSIQKIVPLRGSIMSWHPVPNWSLTFSYQCVIFIRVIATANSNDLRPISVQARQPARTSYSPKPCRIRTSTKYARNSFRIRRSKNIGLKGL